MSLGSPGLRGRCWGLEGSVRGVVASRLRGSIRVVGFVGLVLLMGLGLGLVMVVVMGQVVSIRGGKWRCGLWVRCRRVLWCLRLRFCRLEGR